MFDNDNYYNFHSIFCCDYQKEQGVLVEVDNDHFCNDFISYFVYDYQKEQGVLFDNDHYYN